MFGAVLLGSAKAAAELFDRSSLVQEMFEPLGGGGPPDPSDAFLVGTMGLLGLIAAAYAVSAAMLMRSEELAERAAPVLATSASRLRWMTSHIVFSLLGPAVALAAAGLAGGLIYGVSVGDVGGELPRVFAGSMVQLPAVWLLAAFTVALVGIRPRWSSGAWAPLAVFVFLWFVGTMFTRLSPTLLDVSPFTHVPKLPGGVVTVAPLLWLLAMGAALVVGGMLGFRRRDVGSA